MKKRFARKRAIILASHALAVMAHGDKGGKFHAVDYTDKKVIITLVTYSNYFIKAPRWQVRSLLRWVRLSQNAE